MSRDQQRLFLGLALIAQPAAAVRAQEVVAVLSPAPGPYQAAFEAFEKAYGGGVMVYRLPQDKPAVGRDTRVIVAFGGEAVQQSYPRSATLIACLAPGLSEASVRGGGPFVYVAMRPPAPLLLWRMMMLQPRLKRLAVLWNADGTAGYLNDLKNAASAQGIEIVDVRIRDTRGVPDALRGLGPPCPDAIWLAPDPNLITPGSFQTIKQFSWDNGIPFYAPTAGLAAAGAAAAIGVNAQQIGRADALLSRQALSGQPLPLVAFPENTEVTINRDSAAKSGLKLEPEMLDKADKVLP